MYIYIIAPDIRAISVKSEISNITGISPAHNVSRVSVLLLCLFAFATSYFKTIPTYASIKILLTKMIFVCNNIRFFQNLIALVFAYSNTEETKILQLFF